MEIKLNNLTPEQLSAMSKACNAAHGLDARVNQLSSARREIITTSSQKNLYFRVGDATSLMLDAQARVDLIKFLEDYEDRLNKAKTEIEVIL